jgi:hypothetical protein
MTALTLTFDQVDAGIPAGQLDRARTDIVSTGPVEGRAYAVTISIGGIPDGATADLTLLDEPPDSNPLLTQDSPTAWTLQFDQGCWGPFRVRCRAVSNGAVVASVTRRCSIRSPLLGLEYPANAERTDPNANLVASVASVELTEMNEGGKNRPLVDFYRAVVAQLEGEAGHAGLAVAPGRLTEDASVDPGHIHVVDATEVAGNITLTLAIGIAGQRFGLKVRGVQSFHVAVISIDDEQQIEPRPGFVGVEIPMLDGAYCEWVLDSTAERWVLVANLAGSGAG